MTVRTPDSGFENLERRYVTVARLVPYLLLVVPFIPYVLSQAPSAGAIAITAGVAVAAGAWVARMVVLHPGPPRRPWQGYVYFAGLPAREPLSQRELDILGLIAQGCSNREAAARLFISEATVKTHVLHIYAKLGVNDRAAAVAAGFGRGLLPRP